MKYLTFLSLVFSSLAMVGAHSWVDNIKVTGGAGPIDGSLGYIRGFVGHNDLTSSYMLDSPKKSVYRDNQRQPNQPDSRFQRLKASPGSEITAEWHENGHTTNNTPENNDPGYDSGQVFMYGTTRQPGPDIALEEIWKWTAESSLEGRYLGSFNYDDGMCAEEGSQGRPLAAPRWAAGGGGACKGKFNLPEDLQPGQTFTVYWVWNFSGKVPGGNHFEWYTSVMDIDIVPRQGNFPVDKPTETIPPVAEVPPKPTPSAPTDDNNEEDETVEDDKIADDDTNDKDDHKDETIEEEIHHNDENDTNDDEMDNETNPEQPPLIKRSAKFRAAW